MSEDSVKAALIKLRETLDKSGSVDGETLALAQNLEADIQRLLDTEEGKNEVDTSVDLAIALESRFESEHPLAAGIVREIINALHKMGI